MTSANGYIDIFIYLVQGRIIGCDGTMENGVDYCRKCVIRRHCCLRLLHAFLGGRL